MKINSKTLLAGLIMGLVQCLAGVKGAQANIPQNPSTKRYCMCEGYTATGRQTFYQIPTSADCNSFLGTHNSPDPGEPWVQITSCTEVYLS